MINPIGRSVFSKLIVTVVSFGILMNVVAIAALIWATTPGTYGSKVLLTAIGGLSNEWLDDLGSPTDPRKAAELRRDFGMETVTEDWSGIGVSIDQLRADFDAHERFGAVAGVEMGRYGWRRGIHLKRDGREAYFFFNEDFPFLPMWDRVLALLLVLSLLTVATYYVIRRMLRPLKGLQEGVDAVAAGNVAHKVTVAGNDELSRLGVAFNQMAARITETISARDQLLVDVSHEFRSPLTRMRLALEILGEHEVRGELEEDILELEALVGGVLDSARLDHSQKNARKEPVYLRELVGLVAENFTDKDPGVTLLPTEALLRVEGVELQLEMLFNNLLGNAVKYSKDSGSSIEVGLDRVNGMALVRIRDFGPGIPPDERERVFEPFYRIDKSRAKSSGGYGLGLNICQKIVWAHRGSISLSTPQNGPGLIVEIRLPEMPGPTALT